MKNCKVGHINVNGFGGFKFADVKLWLSSLLFDVLIITETKLDTSLPNSQFEIQGLRLLRVDRNCFGGGVIMYICNDIIYQHLKHLEKHLGIECIAAKLRLRNVWSTLIGLYGSPSLPKNIWRKELASLLEASTGKGESVFLLGDLNCDLLCPDKPPKNGPVDSTGDFQDHPSVRAILENDMERIDFGFSPISTIYIEQLLKEIKVNKSSGYDHITPRLLKESASVICFPLCSIFNASIAQCKYPKNWKKGQVTPLFEKDNELSKTNYRPISVLSAINNIFEKLLASQLQAHFDGILSDYLSAYRRNYSCQTALLRVVEDWKDSLDNNRLVATISTDLSKAFDSLPHPLLN